MDKSNLRIREYLLTKQYTMQRFEEVEKANTIGGLVKFQSDNKYLLMAYNQKEQKLLGKIVANHEKKSIEVLIKEYREHLMKTFAQIPRYGNFVNTFMHILGYFSAKLSASEKEFILDAFEKYRSGLIPASIPAEMLRDYSVEFDEKYLISQSIWEPFPRELLEISDSGKEEE